MIRSGAFWAAILVIPLALAACGSSPSGGAKPGYARPSGQEPTAAVSAPPPLSVRTGNMTQLFATPLLGNAQSAEVVAGFRQDMILYDMSQEGRRLITPVTDYVTGSMLKALERTISDFKKQDLVPAGTDRFFKTAVVSITGQTATLTTCDDGSKYTEVNPATGAVDPTFENVPLDEQYVFETWEMTRLDGHRAIASVTFAFPPAASAKQCLP